MQKETIDLLEKWSEFLGYDPNSKHFKGTLSDYAVQRDMAELMSISEYDNTGNFQLIYASYMMSNLFKSKEMSYLDIITKPDEVTKLNEIWSLFQQPFVKVAKQNFISSLDKIVQNVMSGKTLGDYVGIEEGSINALLKSLIKDLKKLNIEAYSKGSTSTELPIHPYIVVLPNLSTALSQFAMAPDGVYLCYINKDSSLMGWFAFFVKDGDNLVSYNERYNVAYPKQENNMRNGRAISDSKADGIFPYNYIFDYSNHDYKGYSQTYTLDENKLNFQNLSYDAYLPVIIAMILVRGHYFNNVDFLELVYSMPLMLDFVKEQQGGALVPISNTLALSKVYKDTPIPTFDIAKLKEGFYASELNSNERHYKAQMISNNINQNLVEIYGSDFDEACLISGEDSVNALSLITSADIVGTFERIEVFSYWHHRYSLARHIEKKLNAAYTELGGKSGILDWFEKAVRANLEIITEKVLGFNPKDNYVNRRTSHGYSINKKNVKNLSITREYHPNLPYMGNYSLNVNKSLRWRENAVCPITGTPITLTYCCELDSAEAFKTLFGEQYDTLNVPSLLETWDKYKSHVGNSILDMIDPVDLLVHPFKRDNVRFKFTLAFSKKGYLKYVKEHGIVPDKFWLTENKGELE